SQPQGLAVTAAAPLSPDATLSNIAISDGTLTPSFAGATTTYTAVVPHADSTLDVTPTVHEPHATVKVNGTTVSSGSPASGPLVVGANTINVVVTAQDGTTTDTYTLAVNRGAAADADLSGVSLSSGSLSPSFDAATQSYAVEVTNDVTDVVLT